MHDTLKSLEALQEIDDEIAENLREGAENPRRLAELEARLGAARAAVEAEEEKVAQLAQRKKELEEALVDEKDKIKKWEARLTEQRSAREYAALAREIDIAKKQNVTTGEEIAELAKEIKEAEAAVVERQEEFEKLGNEFKDEMAKIRRAIRAQESSKRELEEKRAEAAARVPANMLRRYETIHKRRQHVVVQVVGGACMGCHMNVPPQLYNQLRVRPKIDMCPSCGRMIYTREAFEAAEEIQAGT